jgi:hypothetical protein
VEVIAGLAGIGAVIAGLGALIFFWQTQEAMRGSRRALFDTERQVYLDRMRRARMTAFGLIVLTVFLFLVDVGGSAIANPPPTPTATPSPTPIPTATSPIPTIAPAPTDTLVPTLEPSPTGTPQTATVTGAGTIGLRLRDAPNGNLIDYLPDGTVLTLLSDPRVTTDDGIEWQKVIDPQGRQGWVAVLYITVNP